MIYVASVMLTSSTAAAGFHQHCTLTQSLCIHVLFVDFFTLTSLFLLVHTRNYMLSLGCYIMKCTSDMIMGWAALFLHFKQALENCTSSSRSVFTVELL